MQFRIFGLFLFIISNLNFAYNHIQYERFKRERKLAAIGENVRFDTYGVALKTKLSASQMEQAKGKSNFFKDVIWMVVEYNRCGLMSLLFFLVHLSLLFVQFIQFVIYCFLSAEQELKTEALLSPFLYYTKKLLFVDMFHRLDSSPLYNRVFAVLFLQYFLQKLRSFYIRFKTSKINRYNYTQLNTADLDMAYLESLTSSGLKHCLQALFAGLDFKSSTHYIKKTLLGRRRERNLKFNAKVRELSMIDQVYYFNQLNFDESFQDFPYKMQDKCLEDARLADKRVQAQIKQILVTDKPVTFKQEVGWREYILSFNLSSKINYMAKASCRCDVFFTMINISLMIFGQAFVGGYLIIMCAVLTSWALSDENYSIDRFYHDGTYEYWTIFIFLADLLKTCLTPTICIVNTYDQATLAYSSLVAFSRSRKVVVLLENCYKTFYRSHLRTFCLNRKYKLAEDRKSSQLVFTESDSIAGQETQREILKYRDKIPESSVKEYNENISYLLDLIEILQYELGDYKQRYTM